MQDDSLAGLPLDAQAVTFDFEKGYEFVSGIHSPMYMDIRKIFYDPAIRDKVISSSLILIQEKRLVFDVVAGVETGGIAPAALIAASLRKRFVYIRKKPKEHGLKQMIEGGAVAGKEVLLVEDTVSTGASSLSSIDALKDGNAIVKDCFCIASYDFEEAHTSYDKASISLHALVSAAQIGTAAHARNIITESQEKKLANWTTNPYERW